MRTKCYLFSAFCFFALATNKRKVIQLYCDEQPNLLFRFIYSKFMKIIHQKDFLYFACSSCSRVCNFLPDGCSLLPNVFVKHSQSAPSINPFATSNLRLSVKIYLCGIGHSFNNGPFHLLFPSCCKNPRPLLARTLSLLKCGACTVLKINCPSILLIYK